MRECEDRRSGDTSERKGKVQGVETGPQEGRRMGRLVTLAERIEQGMESSQEKAGPPVANLERTTADLIENGARPRGPQAGARARGGGGRRPRPGPTPLL